MGMRKELGWVAEEIEGLRVKNIRVSGGPGTDRGMRLDGSFLKRQ